MKDKQNLENKDEKEVDINKKSNLKDMNGGTGRLIRRNERSKATIKDIKFRMSIRKEEYQEESDYIEICRKVKKIHLKGKNGLKAGGCVISQSYESETKLRNGFEYNKRIESSSKDLFHKLKLDSLQKKIIGERHLLPSTYIYSSMMNPPNNLKYTHNSERKIYRGGGYCSGFSAREKHGTLMFGSNCDDNQIEASFNNQSGRHNKITDGDGPLCKMMGREKKMIQKEENKERTKINSGEKLVLPRILTTGKNIVSIQNETAPNEKTNCIHFKSKKSFSWPHNTITARKEKMKRWKENESTTYISVDNKVRMPNRL